MLLSEFWPRYIESCKLLRESTRVGYESAWRTHLLSEFGDMELIDITSRRVEEWTARMADNPGGCRKAWQVLHQMLRKAVRWGLIPYDPCSAGVALPKRRPYHAVTITFKETKALLQGFFGHSLEAYVIVSSCLGLRRGEACGVEWDDIDLRAGTVSIRRSVQWVSGHEVVEQPKTDLSCRTLPLPAFAVKRLRRIRSHGRLIGKLTPCQVARRVKAWCRQMALKWIPLSNLRASWATNALEAGVDLKIVSSMLGHSNIETTARYYLLPRIKTYRDAQRKFADAILAA